jgi:hypothetical protein
MGRGSSEIDLRSSEATMPIMTITAKVSKSGDKLVFELPRELKIKPKTYRVERTNNGFELVDPALVAKREKALEKLFHGPCEVPEELIR